MRIIPNNLHLVMITIFLTATALCFSTQAADTKPFAGWGKDSPYNQYYNYKERDKIKGKVIKFKEVTPLPGMAPGTAFIFDDGGEKFLIHLCPNAFATPKETGIRKGIKTTVKGSWALINGEDIFIAAKVQQGENFEFKVRLTKDGTPLWTMSPEEMAKHKR